MIAEIPECEEDGIGERSSERLGVGDRYLDFKSFQKAMGLEVKKEENDLCGIKRSNSF